MSPERPSCVIFDLDGTLVDSRLDIAASLNHGLRRVGAEARGLEIIVPFIGQPLVGIFEALLGPKADLAEEAAAAFRAHYFEHCAVHSRLFPGIEALLDCLDGVPLAIATTKMTFMAVEVVRSLGLASRFAVVQGCDGIPHKPDPAVVNLALSALGGVERQRGWMVGDTFLDVRAGRAAGLSTCAVTWGFGSRESLKDSLPDLTIDEPLQLAFRLGLAALA